MKTAHIVLAAAALLLAACTSPQHRAPVEERGTGGRVPVAVPAAALPASAAEPLVSATVVDGSSTERSAGTYVVRPGDTLIRIGLDSGQNWRDLARWNALDNPNTLEVGQVLRVAPPEAVPGAAVTQSVVPPARADVKPLPAAPGTAAAAASAASTPAAAVGRDSKDPDSDLTWQWPAAGPVLSVFDDARNKGVAIGGKAGDPVLAAADGRVVYAGSGLRGYGNLVIVKHNATYLSAYAHNQALLVKEDQVVRRGQKIAEMGSSDADRVQLHFEVRRLGRPVDPARYLPAR
jgi:lipoprotein NlpD